MHSHFTPDGQHGHDYGSYPDWQWGPPAQQPASTAYQELTLTLTRRMASMLSAVAHDLELTREDTAVLLLRETLWRHYHAMQHI